VLINSTLTVGRLQANVADIFKKAHILRLLLVGDVVGSLSRESSVL